MTDAELAELVRQALRAKHPAPDARASVRSVLLEEVRNATGFGRGTARYCDALVFHFWPSDGLSLTGYEIKVSRADWQRELLDPEKSFAFARYCDFWWVVAGKDGVVRLEELPPLWGYAVLNAKQKLHTVRAASRLPAETLSRELLMAIVRTAACSAWEPLVQAQVTRAGEEARRSEASAFRREREEFAALKERVRVFEEASGVSLGSPYSYENPAQIGGIVRSVRHVLSQGFDGALETITGHSRVLRALAEQCDVAAAEVRALQVEDRRAPDVTPSHAPTPFQGRHP